MARMADPSCCRDKKIFQENFHQVYHGFNHDIWEDFFGGKERDPCCTPMPTCRNDCNGNTSNTPPQNQNGASSCCCSSGGCCSGCCCSGCCCRGCCQDGGNNSEVGQCCQCSSRSGSQTQRDPSCCYTKSAFKPDQIYVGFNESLFGKYTGCQ